MNLIIDVGNTRIKMAVFGNDNLIHNEQIAIDEFGQKVFDLIQLYPCEHAIISNVGSINKSHIELLRKNIQLLELNSTTKVPFENKYATPKTLGVDRIALVASAVTNFPKKNVLVIDAGSCITYDFVNAEGQYLGGAISPGITMRYQALHTFTEKLPFLEPKSVNQLIGDSTEQSIHVGVVNGIISEIDSATQQYRKKNKVLTVVLTGGDVNFLANRLKNGIFANPNFLLEGLNTILTFNLE